MVDAMPFEALRVVRAVEDGVVYPSTLWTGAIHGQAVAGSMAGITKGGFELRPQPREQFRRRQRMTAAGAPWADKKKDELTKEDKRARSQAWKETGIQICIDLINQLREIEGVAGAHVMAIEWEQKVPEIVEAAGLYPRPSVN